MSRSTGRTDRLGAARHQLTWCGTAAGLGRRAAGFLRAAFANCHRLAYLPECSVFTGTKMFTGIVTALGTVRAITPLGNGQDMRLVIAAPWPDTAAIPLGASIACSGCCLTATELGSDWFAADASAETLACTTLGRWRVGTRVNLERSLRLGDEMGGHIVSGHVDGVGQAVSATPENASTRFVFRVPAGLARFIAVKGSIAVDGVSLTVNEVHADTFGVNVIPHTAHVTGFGLLAPGDAVNIEIDMLARYVARLAETA